MTTNTPPESKFRSASTSASFWPSMRRTKWRERRNPLWTQKRLKFQMGRNLRPKQKPKSIGSTPNLFQRKCSLNLMAGSLVTPSSESFGTTRTSCRDTTMTRNGFNSPRGESIWKRNSKKNKRSPYLSSFFPKQPSKGSTRKWKLCWKGMRMAGRTRYWS